ncbi:hypothetical protein CASFOL_026447 [Castilleja foliolosa]|uniref:F-box domain-containing protein n=1 Tax=Castilleja foliolosa TaxID=1961234 RepID=A0ABD3CH61_9LAMI
MVGGNNVRSCKRKRLTEIESLPEEVLFDVLVRLSAQDIYDSARLVCSKWHHMIHTHTFIYAHLQHSTYGLLFQSITGHSFFMTMGENGRAEISMKRYNKIRCPIKTSCNGLLLELECQRKSNYNLYVKNPATRQMLALPQFVGYLNYPINFCFFGIAYAAASMQYKAVILVPDDGTKRTCCILTIGVDNSWRIVGSECKSLQSNGLFSTKLITEGFLHWCYTANNVVLTMNVETEIITETSGPIPRVVYRNRGDIYLSTGIYLSLLRPCGEFCWEVWEMKPKIDYLWRKVCDVSFEAHKYNILKRFDFDEYNYLIPTGWFKYLEVLVFRHRDQFLVLNLLTREIVTIELPGPQGNYQTIVHKNSLVWLGGC